MSFVSNLILLTSNSKSEYGYITFCKNIVSTPMTPPTVPNTFQRVKIDLFISTLTDEIWIYSEKMTSLDFEIV